MDRFTNTRQPDWDWWGKLWPAPGETLRELGVGPGDTLVEIGSGNGYFALPVARIVDPATVYALDIDASLLDELGRLGDQQDIENVVPVHGDARSLSSHLPEPVDVAFLANTFHGIEDPDPFVAEVVKALADGGRFIVVNWRALPRAETIVAGEPRGPPTDLRISADETLATITGVRNGASSRVIDTPPYHYGIIVEW